MNSLLKIQTPIVALVVALTLFSNSVLAGPQPVWADHCADGQVEVGVPIEGDDHCVGGASENPIWVYARGIIRFLSAGVGLVVVLMIIVSGIQYITSAGNPQGVEAAKKKLTNAIVALLLYIFMAAILNFLVPGGIL